MKVDENSDTAFLLLSAVFLYILTAGFALFNLGYFLKYGLKTKKGVWRKKFLVYLGINIAMIVFAVLLTNYLQTQDWLFGFDPYETLGDTSTMTVK